MTKDEIFAAMEKAYTGAGSTVEGSFAGDLLRACADGCAELWSTEIDGLEERAFVASAAGVAAAQSVVDEKRPIGADAKVFAAVEKPLNIAASVVLSEGTSLEGVVNAFKGAFTAFCREGALTTCLVSYARVSAILLDQEGVADVTAFTLGGAGTSFALGEREIGVPGTVTLTEVTA